ncbi:MAG: LPS export ABC transporter periplasmic protein LptC [Dysgonamonadaceae bacterium]|nr:LPS export ABC transporter periplasmic protein LptC [Dysgonamonadaceae bacterium]
MVLQTKTSVTLIFWSCLLTISCSQGNKMSAIEVDAQTLPLTHAENILSLISDSGITRYRLQTKVWDVYSKANTSYWHFPKGIYLEKFDSLFNVVGSVKSDTAYYFEDKELWKLIGNVYIVNQEGDKFETSELFWKRSEPAWSRNSIYTDKFVRIERGDQIITMKGLRSNQLMDDYVFYSNAIEMIVEDN